MFLLVNLIRCFEDALASDEESLVFADIRGMWHDSFTMGDTREELYHFKIDGDYTWLAAEADSEKHLKSFDGTWWLEGYKVIIYMSGFQLYVGGEVAEPDMFSSGDFIIEGGELEFVPLSPPLLLRLPLGDHDAESMRIAGRTF